MHMYLYIVYISLKTFLKFDSFLSKILNFKEACDQRSVILQHLLQLTAINSTISENQFLLKGQKLQISTYNIFNPISVVVVIQWWILYCILSVLVTKGLKLVQELSPKCHPLIPKIAWNSLGMKLTDSTCYL